MSAAETLGAFIPGPRLARPGAASGVLAGLAFAVKDVMEVAGTSTGNGHPDWLATHPPAARSAATRSAVAAAGGPRLRASAGAGDDRALCGDRPRNGRARCLVRHLPYLAGG